MKLLNWLSPKKVPLADAYKLEPGSYVFVFNVNAISQKAAVEFARSPFWNDSGIKAIALRTNGTDDLRVYKVEKNESPAE